MVQQVRLTPQAQKNLALASAPLKPATYWLTIDVPGVVVDRPGVSDRGVIAPVTGVVTQILARPGATVEPQQALFTLRLISESLHASQLELFKATREIQIAQAQRKRLADLAQSGALAQSRIIEIENQIARFEVNVEAYGQDLQARGLSKSQIESAARGEFVTEVTVYAPDEAAMRNSEVVLASASETDSDRLPFALQLEELNVELGQQVQAGGVLCRMADHRALLIEGRAFKDDLPLIQQAAKNGWPVEVEFDASPQADWPPVPASLPIHTVHNTIDEASRTFAFDLLLENQWQSYQVEGGDRRLLWRFRPGDRLRLRVAVGKLEGVLVLPREAVVREGPEAYVFRQNGDLFERKSVHALHEDHLHVVIANDGSVRPGLYVAQNAAASLNRVLKAQQSSGLPANLHVHADGTVHAAH
jgi:multidrug efflux pump subunit AcrA (membrane-fusion protein)